MKQETLEEAALKYKNLKLPDDLYDAFIKGAKYQAERMYSEQEVLQHLNQLLLMPNSELDTFTDDNEMLTTKWFDQFKKK